MEFRFGKPRTDEERKQRHKGLFGTSKLPPRGTGRGKNGYQNVYQAAVNKTKRG